MKFWDTETQLIMPGLTAPPLACLQVCDLEGDASILHWTQAGTAMDQWLDSDESFCGANVGFDWCVMSANFPLLLTKIFKAYNSNRVYDVHIRQKLIDIATGCYRGFLNSKWQWVPFQYNLERITIRHSEMRLNKDEAIRLTYGTLRDLPVSQWSEAHRKYAEEDALATRACFLGQERVVARNAPVDLLADQFNQVRYDFAMKLASAWGLRTDEFAVKELERQTEEKYQKLQHLLIEESLVRADGSRDTKAAKARMLAVCGFQSGAKLGEYVPISALPQRKMHLTDKGDVSLSSEACKDSEDPVLIVYGEYGEQKSVLSKDVKALLQGVFFPLHTRFDIAESGRRTSSNPNVQNWRRLPGIREAFRPRKGRVYAQADVEGLELGTLAQVCYSILGWSKLGDAINAGLDVHLDIGAFMLGITYEEAKRRKKLGDLPALKALADFEKDRGRIPQRHEVSCSDAEWTDYCHYIEIINARQAGKVANFGFPGGLGVDSMIAFAKATYGVILTQEQCRRLKDMWLAKWPEMNEYFAYIGKLTQDGTGTVVQLRSNRIRGNVTFCGAANSFFQGLGADATLSAAWELTQECYDRPQSVMYGSRVVNYVHDEFIVETDDNDRAHDVAMRLERVMIDAIQPWVPNVRVAAPPLLMRYWSKNAKAVHDKVTGRLVPWS